MPEGFFWVAVLASTVGGTIGLGIFSWLLMFIVRGNFRGWHTRRVISTGIAWLLTMAGAYSDPDIEPALFLGLMFSGPLALGYRIFANPPPLEDEEENGEEPSESDHLQT